jgi:hypothetical protein
MEMGQSKCGSFENSIALSKHIIGTLEIPYPCSNFASQDMSLAKKQFRGNGSCITV